MDILENDELSYVVCPTCKHLVDSRQARAVGMNQIDLMLGYFVICDYCKEVNLLNYAGHPPIFDLKLGSMYVLWKIPEA